MAFRIPVILYSNDSGTSGNITLAETAASFTMLEVFYFNDLSGINVYSSQCIYNPNGKTITFSSTGAVDTTIQHSFASYKINGTSMTAYGEHYFNVKINENTTVSGGIASSSGRHNFICCVVGYR